MKIVWLLCLLCLGGSLKAQVLSDSVSCRLSGRVVSGEDGKPLPGAHIFMEGLLLCKFLCLKFKPALENQGTENQFDIPVPGSGIA